MLLLVGVNLLVVLVVMHQQVLDHPCMGLMGLPMPHFRPQQVIALHVSMGIHILSMPHHRIIIHPQCMLRVTTQHTPGLATPHRIMLHRHRILTRICIRVPGVKFHRPMLIPTLHSPPIRSRYLATKTQMHVQSCDDDDDHHHQC
ncbi:hypothetical protein WN944_007586 [Citrus x changshan-huyou]|uniref:Secreted protein n=1 Tax=Citrus x changshan-huyou TaxID=2935761 RepID=A0AAP0QUD6_9ROSI